MFDRRLVSKTLSKVAAASVEEILSDAIEDVARRARVVGITGAPGAGKSTLIGRLAARRLGKCGSLAIVAIDPTSPHSDGSLLGDRIRMGSLSEDPRVFIRSLPSRTAEDGLTENMAEIIATLDRFNFDEVLVETVGAGQTAYGVRSLADVSVLVLTPGAGDYVQAMKAGIMETADLYVVNKSDLPGADRVVAELLGVLRHGAAGVPPPVIQVRADADTGVDELDVALDRHFAACSDPARRAEAESVRRKYRIHKLLQRRLHEALNSVPADVWNEPVRAGYRRVLQELAAAARR
jgi:LAO/AO transport system kinase